MNYEKAKSYNDKLTEQIRDLQSKYLSRYEIRIVERQGARRQIVEEEKTDYITEQASRELYKDFRKSYPDTNNIFIVIDPVEDVKRSIKLRLPVRTDEDREPVGPDPVGVGEINDLID